MYYNLNRKNNKIRERKLTNRIIITKQHKMKFQFSTLSILDVENGKKQKPL